MTICDPGSDSYKIEYSFDSSSNYELKLRLRWKKIKGKQMVRLIYVYLVY